MGVEVHKSLGWPCPDLGAGLVILSHSSNGSVRSGVGVALRRRGVRVSRARDCAISATNSTHQRYRSLQVQHNPWFPRAVVFSTRSTKKDDPVIKANQSCVLEIFI